jgi:hypothetical protein
MIDIILIYNGPKDYSQVLSNAICVEERCVVQEKRPQFGLSVCPQKILGKQY